MKEFIPMPVEQDIDRFTDEEYDRREQEQYRVSAILNRIKENNDDR